MPAVQGSAPAGGGGGGGLSEAEVEAIADASSASAAAALVDASPATLDTLNELAAALGDDADFATTITNLLAGKQDANADLTDLIARWVAASASGPASLDFLEDSDNGTNRMRVIAPAALGADRTLTLPDATGTVALAPVSEFRSTSTSSAVNTTETVIHSFSRTLPPDRKMKITMSGMLRGSGGTTTRRTAIAFLRQGTTTGGTQILRADKVVTDDALERRIQFSVMEVIQDTGAGGATDFVVTILRSNGSNDIQLEGATQPTVVTFEDYGPKA